jgi:hypothetical protein
MYGCTWAPHKQELGVCDHQIEGVLKRQKRIGDDVGDFKYVFTKKKRRRNCVKITPLICCIHLIMQEYDSKCLKMYLIILKVSKKIF